MSYRVETAASGRAGCQGTECKNNGIKIEKDDLRVGVWVEFQERGSWLWRHWGCVTGKMMENLRKYLDPNGTGNYEWDRLDGYDGAGAEKNSLDHVPELQEKVRRCITQGFIDPEDFNGDPEMNKLGESGLRTAESKKKIRQDKISRDHELAELREKLEAVTAERDALLAKGGNPGKLDVQLQIVKDELEAKESPKKPAAKKRGAAKMEADDDEEEKKPATKKRNTKVKKEAGEDAGDGETKPAPKKRATKVKEADGEADQEEIKPAKKARAKKAVKQEDTEEAASEQAKPARKPRAKKVSYNEDTDEADHEEADHEEEVQEEAKPAKKSRANKVVKKEDDSADDEQVRPAKPVKKPRVKKAAKKKLVDDDEPVPELVDTDEVIVKKEDGPKADTEVEGVVKKEPGDEVSEEVPEHVAAVQEKPKRGRAKKGAAKA